MAYAAAASPYSQAAYTPPAGTAALPTGVATYHFLKMPLTVSVWQFLGIAWLIFYLTRHWGKFVNAL